MGKAKDDSGTTNANFKWQKLILNDERLTANEKWVATILIWHRNDNTGACYPSHGRVAKAASLSRKTVINSIKGLEKKGVVKVIRRVGSSNTYRFLAGGV